MFVPWTCFVEAHIGAVVLAAIAFLKRRRTSIFHPVMPISSAVLVHGLSWPQLVKVVALSRRVLHMCAHHVHLRLQLLISDWFVALACDVVVPHARGIS